MSASRLLVIVEPDSARAPGRLFTTSDGGRRRQSLPGVGALYGPGAVGFASVSDGIIGLDPSNLGPLADASVLRTSDGGRIWTPELLVGRPQSPADVLATSGGDLSAPGSSAR